MAADGVALEKAAGFLGRPPVRQAHHESLHEEFKRRIKTQTALPCAEAAATIWALLASGQIIMRNLDGWQSLAEKPPDQPIDLAA
jgi:putative transposase